AVDNAGYYAAAPLTVTVHSLAATASPSGPSTVNERSPYTLNLSATSPSNDPITKWIVNWGDSHSETIIGHPSTLQHVSPDNNPTPYTIIATAYVAGGAASAPATKSVTVLNVVPTFNILPNATLGESGQYSVALHYSHPGADTFNWGDGMTST